jgi:hypothetical protein
MIGKSLLLAALRCSKIMGGHSSLRVAGGILIRSAAGSPKHGYATSEAVMAAESTVSTFQIILNLVLYGSNPVLGHCSNRFNGTRYSEARIMGHR